MTVPDRKQALESSYGLELATFFVAQGNYDRARYYVNACMENFLTSWVTVHPLLVVSRRLLVQVCAAECIVLEKGVQRELYCSNYNHWRNWTKC